MRTTPLPWLRADQCSLLGKPALGGRESDACAECDPDCAQALHGVDGHKLGQRICATVCCPRSNSSGSRPSARHRTNWFRSSQVGFANARCRSRKRRRRNVGPRVFSPEKQYNALHCPEHRARRGSVFPRFPSVGPWSFHGPGCSTAWTSSPSAFGPHAADFVLHLKDAVKAFKSHVGPTLFNASGWFRFQVVAQPNDMLEMPLREHAGRLGVTTELYAGGWGWGQFIHRSVRDRFTHIDDDSLKDARLHFKLAYRASLLQLHRQTFALAHYVRSRTDLSDHCVSDSAVLLALTFDFFRNLPDEHGRVARQILCKFISCGLECLVLPQPIVFASLTSEEIHAILYHTQRDPSPSLHDSTVSWIHGAYIALKRSLQAAQETVREQTRAEGDVLLGAEAQLPGLIEQPPPAFPSPLPPGCTPVPSSHALNPLLPTALDKQKGIMVMERSL